LSFTLAISGKGGTGKTTLAAMAVDTLAEFGMGPVLAVDADPNSTLSEALGIERSRAIVDVLEEMRKDPDSVPSGMTKPDYVQFAVQSAVIEGPGVDVLVMGRPEGPGCYCYVNSLLRDVVGRLADSYRSVVVDNEAGMEHLSRRTMRAADVFLMVSDGTAMGVRTAIRIAELAKELEFQYGRMGVVLNRAAGPVEALRQVVERAGVGFFGGVPFDEELAGLAAEGAPVRSLRPDSPARVGFRRILGELAGAGGRGRT